MHEDMHIDMGTDVHVDVRVDVRVDVLTTRLVENFPPPPSDFSPSTLGIGRRQAPTKAKRGAGSGLGTVQRQ